jgi:rRNA biogenesis protein RRP5
MKMWGAVAEINNKDLVVSLPGGLRGFVRAEEASEVLAKDTRNTKKRRKKEKSSVTGNNHGDAVEVLDEVFLQKLWISPI